MGWSWWLDGSIGGWGTKKARQRMESNASSISGFDDDSDGDDPFGVKSSPPKKEIEEPVAQQVEAPKDTGLLGDDDDDDIDYTAGLEDNNDETFDSKPETAVPDNTVSAKAGLFSDEDDDADDDIFGTLVARRIRRLQTLHRKVIFSDDDDDDDVDFGGTKAPPGSRKLGYEEPRRRWGAIFRRDDEDESNVLSGQYEFAPKLAHCSMTLRDESDDPL